MKITTCASEMVKSELCRWMAAQAEATSSAADIPNQLSCFQANLDTHPCKWAAVRLFAVFAELSLINLCLQPLVNAMVPSTALGDVTLWEWVTAWLDNVHFFYSTSSHLESVTAEAFCSSRLLWVATCCFAVCQSCARVGIWWSREKCQRSSLSF